MFSNLHRHVNWFHQIHYHQLFLYPTKKVLNKYIIIFNVYHSKLRMNYLNHFHRTYCHPSFHYPRKKKVDIHIHIYSLNYMFII